MVGGRNREISRKKALRKRRIDHEVYPEGTSWYDNLHQYSKNKIHCSCPMCSAKTNNKKLYTCGYKPSDLRKIEDMDSQELEVVDIVWVPAAAGYWEDEDGQLTIGWYWELKE